MFRVRMTSRDKTELFSERLVERRRVGGDQWEYFADTGWFKTEAEAEAQAASYLHRNVQLEIIWKGADTRDWQIVKQLRAIEPRQIYEAKRAQTLRNAKASPLSTIKSGFAKLGTAIQAIFFFLLAISPLAGSNGERWDLALLIGVGAVVIFLIGKQMGSEAAKEKFGKAD